MSGRICGQCGKRLASRQSLWNHKQISTGGGRDMQHHPAERKQHIGVKRSASDHTHIPIFDGSEFVTGKPISKET